MKMTNTEYGELTKRSSPNTRMYKTVPSAFLVGGLICCLGQALTNLYTYWGMEKTEAGVLTSITLVFLSMLFTAIGLYQRLAKFAGAGTLVPITGFANSVVSPAVEFKSEGFVLGLGAKIFIICGPVILYGISASIIYGFIYWLTKVL